MLEFRDIQISDKKWIDELLSLSDFMGCEYSFANNLAWRRQNDSVICRYKDFYIVRSGKEKPVFTFPAGKGDYKDVLFMIKAYAESLGHKAVIWNASAQQISLINEIFDNKTQVLCDESQYDYIYLAKELAEFKGKKFHSKKNHLNAFKKYNWSFEELTEKDFDECIVFCANDYTNNNREEHHSAVAEQFAIHTYFMNYHELGLKGGILRVDGKIVAVSIGERLNSETFVVHIEKADTSYRGAYTAMCNEFVKHFATDVKYINREEDLGIEGLRKSKKSYNPVFLLQKDIITF